MSVADRDYWKDEEPSTFSSLPSWPVTYWLMGILVVCFAGQCINDVYIKASIDPYLALTREGILSGWIWQLLSFQFLHGSTFHLIFNLLGLWFLGRSVEQVLGRSRFVLAYFGSGIVGGVLQSVLMWAFPALYAGYVVGASAGILGILTVFCLLHADATFRLYLLIPVSARVLLYITAGVELFFTLVPSHRDGAVAHPAHLGGMMLGALWVRSGWHHDWNPLPGAALVDRIKNLFYRPHRAPKLRVLKGGTQPTASRIKTTPAPTVVNTEDLAPDEFIAREVDPILDKIAAHGMSSLTEKERRVLAAARDKVSKR
jgi:membrane associated rhomboid family serine protease